MDGQAKVNLILELKNRIKTGLQKAKESLNKDVQDMKSRLKDLKTSHLEAFKTMGERIPGVGSAISMLGSPVAMLTTAMLGLGLAAGAVVNRGMQINKAWDAGMAKINVTAQLSRAELKKLDQEIDAIAAKGVVPYEEVPEAFNRIISAGLSAKEALGALDPTLRAAKAGFTDIETVAAAGVSVMNSSGLKDITQVYDVLFATLNKGNAEFKDIAQYLPKIIPAARGVGVSLYDTAGAYAYLTAQGQTAERSATLLENAFKVLGDSDKVKSFKKIGVAFYDVKGQMKPILDIAKDLNVALGGLTDLQRAKALGSLGLDMEAASAFSALSQDIDKLKDTIDFTTKSTGQLEQAFENAKQKGDSWIIINNKIKSSLNAIGSVANTVWGKLGDLLLPAFTNKSNPLDHLFAGASSSPDNAFDKARKQEQENWKRTPAPIKAKINANNLSAINNNFMPATVYKAANNAMPMLSDLLAKQKQDKSLYDKTKPSATVKKLLAEMDTKTPGTGSKRSESIQGATPKTVNFNIGSIINGDWITKNEEFQNMSPAMFEKYLIDLLKRMQANQDLAFN
ncbi:MAG: phage tail tape measure protein [Sphingobacteriia bacterium]|nr:MAG: phage tail tape measure protein [Sphingobacteriia bacterium]